jgi:hypothetical protein
MEQLNINMGEMNMIEQKPTVYQQNRALFDGFKDRFPNIVALSKITTNLAQMDEAVGSASGGCVSHWVRGSNKPGGGSERRAGDYLKRIANNHPAPVVAAPVTPVQSASMFIISVPENTKTKAEMLLNMLRNIGCEVVDF